MVDVRVGVRIDDVAKRWPRGPARTCWTAGGTVLPGRTITMCTCNSAAAAETSIRSGRHRYAIEPDWHRVGGAGREDGWIRASGYNDSVAGPLDRAALGRFVPTVPLRVQHRSGVWGASTRRGWSGSAWGAQPSQSRMRSTGS